MSYCITPYVQVPYKSKLIYFMIIVYVCIIEGSTNGYILREVSVGTYN